nr:hypothetical protein [uncultured Dongia sp.]
MTQHGVNPAYRHQDKLVMPRDTISLKGAKLKWYDLAPADLPVPDAIRQLAQAYLLRTDIDLGDDLGFVILHRCGQEFYFLLVSTWRGNNELWETVHGKVSDAHADFAVFPQESPHRGTFCVWELGAVWHEQQAWKTYLRSSRDEAAQQAYLGDSFAGIV